MGYLNIKDGNITPKKIQNDFIISSGVKDDYLSAPIFKLY